MSGSPSVTVVLAVRNGERTVRAAIDSVVAQRFEDWELLVVDDGSTDGTADVLGSVTDDRVTVLTQPPTGVSAARNAAIERARGRLLAFVDADDVLEPDKLQRQVAHLAADKAVDLSYAWRLETDEHLQPLRVHAVAATIGAVDIATGHPIGPYDVLVHTDAVRAVGGFDPALATGEDRDLWLRLALAGARMVRVDQVLARRRLGPRTFPDVGERHAQACRVVDRGFADARFPASHAHRHPFALAAEHLEWGVQAALAEQGETAEVLLGRGAAIRRWQPNDPRPAVAIIENVLRSAPDPERAVDAVLGALPPVLGWLRDRRDAMVDAARVVRSGRHAVFGRREEALADLDGLSGRRAHLAGGAGDLLRHEVRTLEEARGAEAGARARSRLRAVGLDVTGATWRRDPLQGSRLEDARRSRPARAMASRRGAEPLRVAMLVNLFPVPSETFIVDEVVGLLSRGIDVTILPHVTVSDPAIVHPEVHRHALMARVRPLLDAAGPGRTARHALAQLRAAIPQHEFLRAHPIRPARAVANLVASGPFDLVHAQFGPNGRLALDLRRMGAFAAPIVTTFHGGHGLGPYLAEHGRDSYDQLFAEGEGFLAVSRGMAEQLEALGAPPDRLTVRHLPMATRPDRDPVGDRDDSEVRVVIVARLVPRKGVDVALDALGALSPEVRDRIGVEVIGDGPERASLEARSSRLGLDATVTFAGWRPRDEVLRRVDDADIVLVPSVTGPDGGAEGLPVTIMEALAGGVAVVATDHSAAGELVLDGVTGMLVPERDPRAMAGALAALVVDPARRVELGRRGRQHLAEQHDPERQLDLLVATYDAALDRWRSARPSRTWAS